MKVGIEGTITRAYSALIKTGNSLQSPLLLAVRFYWGWQFIQTGWGKLNNIPHVTQFFMSLGIPAPGLNAWVVSLMEFLGGILLIVGFGSRLTGLALTVDMVVAYLTADREALRAIFSDPGKFYNADPYTFLFASLLVFVFGPGRFALDHLVSRHFADPAANPSVSKAVDGLSQREIPVGNPKWRDSSL
jgi:putative oxidoreductase